MDLEKLKSDKVLDTRGLTTPLPVLKMMHAIESFSTEKILEVWCSDPHFQDDFRELCEAGNIRLLGRLDDPDGHVRYFIQKTIEIDT